MHRAHQPWLLALALAVGCAPGKSELSVTVDATGMIASLDHLQVALTDSTGRHAGPYSIAVPGGTIPPSTNFALAFSKDVHGTVNVTVSAVDNAGSSLASGAGDVDVQPSHQANLTVTLAGGTTGGDGGDTTDMTVIPGYHLVFSVQPSNTNVATPLSPSVSVVLTDGNGATIPVSDPVTQRRLDGERRALLRAELAVEGVGRDVARRDQVVAQSGNPIRFQELK